RIPSTVCRWLDAARTRSATALHKRTAGGAFTYLVTERDRICNEPHVGLLNYRLMRTAYNYGDQIFGSFFSRNEPL
ncbi:unnamed protein product, partial [Nesidiocoris tenuis]